LDQEEVLSDMEFYSTHKSLEEEEEKRKNGRRKKRGVEKKDLGWLRKKLH
jgi:hypothetical protein